MVCEPSLAACARDLELDRYIRLGKGEEMTGGRVTLGPGTLYGAINSLLERGWIVLYSAELGSRKKKEYVITPAGRSAFDAEMARLRELVRNGEKMEDET